MNKDTTKPTTFDSVLNSVYGDPTEGTSKTDMDTANEFENVIEDKIPADNSAGKKYKWGNVDVRRN